MKKLLQSALMIGCSITFLNAQTPKWLLGSSEQDAAGAFYTSATNRLHFYEVDFNGTSPVCSQRIEGASIQNINCFGTEDVINCGLDSVTGQISFYAFIAALAPWQSSGPSTPDTVYFAAYNSSTGADEIFGKAGTDGWGASVIESALVKRPGSATDYYFIYKTKATSLNPDRVLYVIVNPVAKTVSAPIVIINAEKNGEGMAVSQLDCTTNQRWLFTTRLEASGDITMRRAAITNAGIAAPVNAYSIVIPGNGTPLTVTGVEISPTNDKLAVSNYSSVAAVTKDVLLFDFNNLTGALTNEQSYTNTLAKPIVTMEFSPDGSRIYFLQGGSSTIETCIYNCPVTASGGYSITAGNKIAGLYMPVSLTIESGYDGRIYANPGHNASFLYMINNPNSATVTIDSTNTSFFGAGQRIGSGFPDQVDGEDGVTYPCSTIGVSEESVLKGVNIYPVPSRDVLHIDLSNIDVSLVIYDQLGRMIYSTELTQLHNAIDTKDYSAGVYLLQLSLGDKKTTKRIVISK